MKRQICTVATAAAMAITLGVAPASANGAAHYSWDDGVGEYGGPAAAVVNKAGAVVWWQVPGTDVQIKDVYKLKAFEGSSTWPMSTLNQPVKDLLTGAFPNLDTIHFTRTIVESAPSFPQGEVITP